MARATLKPMLFSAIASRSSGRGTCSGVSDCSTGVASAEAMPAISSPATSSAGVIAPACVVTPRYSAARPMTMLTPISSRRRLTTSASAPAGSASRNSGSVAATCTSATQVALGAISVISQPAPTSRIQVPMLPTSAAVHMTAKTRCLNGAQAPAGGALIVRAPCSRASGAGSERPARTAQRAPEAARIGGRHGARPGLRMGMAVHAAGAGAACSPRCAPARVNSPAAGLRCW